MRNKRLLFSAFQNHKEINSPRCSQNGTKKAAPVKEVSFSLQQVPPGVIRRGPKASYIKTAPLPMKGDLCGMLFQTAAAGFGTKLYKSIINQPHPECNRIFVFHLTFRCGFRCAFRSVEPDAYFPSGKLVKASRSTCGSPYFSLASAKALIINAMFLARFRMV